MSSTSLPYGQGLPFLVLAEQQTPHLSANRAKGLRESNPTKCLETPKRGALARGVPSDQYRSCRGGYHAFSPTS